METARRINILSSLALISVTIPYYDYAYDWIKLLRNLSTKSRYIWLKYIDLLVNMPYKQIIDLMDSQIDQTTINIFKKADRYKSFKFKFRVGKDDTNIEMVLKMLEELQSIEIEKLLIETADRDIISALIDKAGFKTDQQLLKAIDISVYQDNFKVIEDNPYQYLSSIYRPEKFDMTKLCK